MQKKDIYLICMTMIICSIIIGLLVGNFILHGLEDIASNIINGLLTINQSIHWQEILFFYVLTTKQIGVLRTFCVAREQKQS